MSLARTRLVSTLVLTLVLAPVLALSACTTPKPQPEAPPASGPVAVAPELTKTWPAKMQALSQTLSTLMPLVVSRAKFNNEKNFAKIDANVKQLQGLTHTLKNVEPPNSDPTMRVMTGLFDEDISRALLSLQNGDREYARQTLSDTTSYCIQCHTQTNNGPDFPKLDLSLNAKDLPPIDQAEFYAATRQFDRALDAYVRALNDEALAKRDVFEWEEAARSALAITVRVKNDPKVAAQLLSKIQIPATLPKSTQQSLFTWKAAVKSWEAEPLPKSPLTPQETIVQAEKLLAKAEKSAQFPMDHGQDVLYFRAAAMLHDLLQKRSEKDTLTARALYDAGLAAEATRDMNFWTLHESYYEQCVRTQPHTKVARSCFTRLNDSVTLGYSGSGGVRIPAEIAKRLEVFRNLSR